jgi:hypothetical protein
MAANSSQDVLVYAERDILHDPVYLCKRAINRSRHRPAPSLRPGRLAWRRFYMGEDEFELPTVGDMSTPIARDYQKPKLFIAAKTAEGEAIGAHSEKALEEHLKRLRVLEVEERDRSGYQFSHNQWKSIAPGRRLRLAGCFRWLRGLATRQTRM